MVSGCPFLIQVTVVAGEPVEIQVTVEDMNPRVTDVMLGGAGEEHSAINSATVIQWNPSNVDTIGTTHACLEYRGRRTSGDTDQGRGHGTAGG